jgi:peptidoglycan L-alanyl-D-glutamate endopeptidase CwlK
MIQSLDPRSERNLRGVNENLVAVVRRAAEIVQDRDDGLGFIVIEGLRTEQRQAELVKAGASRTMNSRHLIGQAVDLAATVRGSVRWDWPLYGSLAAAMKQAAAELGVVITWGGDWRSFRDGPHFQIEPTLQKA